MAKIRVLTKDGMIEYDTENQKDLENIKKKMRTACRGDWHIVEWCSEFPYAAAFYGCYDMAHKGFTTVRANYGDEILAACIFCNCPVQEVIKHHAHGSHPDLLVVHRDECPAYEQIQAALKRTAEDKQE